MLANLGFYIGKRLDLCFFFPSPDFDKKKACSGCNCGPYGPLLLAEYAYGDVFEIRVSSGYGAQWFEDGTKIFKLHFAHCM